ncbi:MAG: phosphopantetheine adenylyltransferase, partial [Pseudomonas sp.]|nr:phosphopantetheine adenylyltransferase [Pseudomonas sp.]
MVCRTPEIAPHSRQIAARPFRLYAADTEPLPSTPPRMRQDAAMNRVLYPGTFDPITMGH